MTKLTKLQYALIETAAICAEGALLPAPDTAAASDAALRRALNGLIRLDLAEQGKDDADSSMFVLTEAGREVVVRKNDATKPGDAPTSPTSQPRPGGKLGVVLKAIRRKRGATLAELTEITGWQPHTARAALSRLRQRGFPAVLSEESGRKAYRLEG